MPRAPDYFPERELNQAAVRLSQEEVARLIDSAVIPFHRVLLMTLYATGVRRAELTHLKVSAIDSERMVIRIRGGKGRKDRELMLSAKLLEALRDHWRRHKPKEWLFPGGRWHNSTKPITTKAAWQARRSGKESSSAYIAALCRVQFRPQRQTPERERISLVL